MQISELRGVEQTLITQPMYQISYLEFNKIGKDGYASVKDMCKYIKW